MYLYQSNRGRRIRARGRTSLTFATDGCCLPASRMASYIITIFYRGVW